MSMVHRWMKVCCHSSTSSAELHLVASYAHVNGPAIHALHIGSSYRLLKRPQLHHWCMWGLYLQGILLWGHCAGDPSAQQQAWLLQVGHDIL